MVVEDRAAGRGSVAGPVAEVLRTLRAGAGPRDGLGDGPFKLACSFERPADDVEIALAWPEGAAPAELVEMWSTSRRSRLFEDIEYGQWGLLLLSPGDASRRTAAEFAERPEAYRAGDIVIGEFLGDQDLVVLARSGAGRRRVLIALPVDDRPDWPVAGDGLVVFLERYLGTVGRKYWE